MKCKLNIIMFLKMSFLSCFLNFKFILNLKTKRNIKKYSVVLFAFYSNIYCNFNFENLLMHFLFNFCINFAFVYVLNIYKLQTVYILLNFRNISLYP